MLLASCYAPQTPRYHQSTMTDAEYARAEAHINQVEEDSYRFRDRERMSNARATEMATRHNPTHVTNNRTSFWFW
jgi:hypothetical protein